jgi:hypothetical protein
MEYVSIAMTKQIDMQKIQNGIARVLRGYFENLKIRGVHVKEDVDQDGDEILRVLIVFEGDLEGNDVRRAVGAASRIRPVLEAYDADLFPLLSFVSKLDYDRGRARRAAG